MLADRIDDEDENRARSAKADWGLKLAARLRKLAARLRKKRPYWSVEQ